MEWSLGLVVGIAIVALVLIALVVRLRASADKRRARRIDSLVGALTAHGFSAEKDAEIPVEAPDWEVAPRDKRAARAIRIERGDSTVFVFDHVQIDKGYSGWNMESTSSGDSGTTRTYRHTVACLHAQALAMPSFEVIPNIRTKMTGVADASIRDLEAEGHAKTAGAIDMLMGLVGSFEKAHERPGALTIANHPELSTAFNIYGEDPSTVGALLDGPLRERLVLRPGLILEAQGPWLIATFNVGVAFGYDRGSELAAGLLSPGQTVSLVELAFELRDDLGSASSERQAQH